VDDGGERATAEVRIKALSSQHEDMSFRIRFTAVPPASSNLVPLSVITEPIKVLSKLSQLPKEKLHATVPRTKKRHVPAENSITASLLRIETQQRHQQALIDSLVQTMHTLQQGDQQPLHKRMRISSEDKPNHQESQGSDIQPSTLPAARGLAQAFEHSLKDLIATFPHLPTEQCAVSIRRVFGEHPANTSQLVEALLAECPTKGYGLTCGLPPNHDTASDAEVCATYKASHLRSSPPSRDQNEQLYLGLSEAHVHKSLYTNTPRAVTACLNVSTHFPPQ